MSTKITKTTHSFVFSVRFVVPLHCFTYSGTTTISQGRLALTTATALPATANIVIGDANSGTTAPNLYLGNQLVPTFATLTVGSGVTGAALHTSGWAPTVSGVTTLNSPLTIRQYNGGGIHTGLQTNGVIAGPGAGAGNDTLILTYGGSQNFYWQANNIDKNTFAGNIRVTGAPGNMNMQGGANGSNNVVIPDTAMVTIASGCVFRWNNFGNNAVNETFDGLAGAGHMSRNTSGGLNNTLALTGGSKIAWEVADWTGAAGAGYDKLTAAALNLTATSGNRITIRLADPALTNFTEASKTFVLIQTTSGITGFSADKFTVDTGALTAPKGTWAVQQSGTSLLLAYTANPDANGNGILDNWEITHFGNTHPGANLPGDDADQDGLCNLMEYALDTDPLANNPGPAVDFDTLGGGEHLRLTVNKNPQATNLTYTVETCSALNDWSAINTVIEPSPATQLIVRDTFNTSTSPRRFIRLRVRVTP